MPAVEAHYQKDLLLQVPGAKEEWGVAGGSEMGSITEDSEQQVKQDTPEEAVPTTLARNSSVKMQLPAAGVWCKGGVSSGS